MFDYFRTKEDLFYSRLEAFGGRLLDAISARTAGEPVLEAFRRFLLDAGGLLGQAEAGDTEALAQLRRVNRLIAASPALLAREQQAITRSTDALADLLADETGAPPDDIRPQVVANALMGVQRTLLDQVRRRVRLRRLTGGGDVWFGESVIRYADGKVVHGARVIEFRDGKIWKETRYYGEPFEAPAWRAQWAQRIEEPVASA